MVAPILSTVAVSLALIAEGRYIYSIFRGDTKPNFSGWFIFTLSMTCVVVSSYGIGARETLPVVLAYTILHGIVAVLSLRYGYVRFTKVDTLLVMCSLAGVVLWYLTTSPWYALLINLCIDIFGYATIAYKTYLHPETEDRFAWAIGGLAYALNLLTIDVWVPEEYLFSLSNVFWCFTILLLTLFLAPKNRAF